MQKVSRKCRFCTFESFWGLARPPSPRAPLPALAGPGQGWTEGRMEERAAAWRRVPPPPLLSPQVGYLVRFSATRFCILKTVFSIGFIKFFDESRKR